MIFEHNFEYENGVIIRYVTEDASDSSSSNES
jgi:hypothetical protein